MMRARIVAAARQCIGTPFRHQGRVPGVGLDCVGLLVHVARRLGLSDYDRADYARRPPPGLMVQHLVRAGLSRLDAAPDVGDVALFGFDGAPPQHAAILSDRGMIHAYLPACVVVEHSFDAVWQQRLAGAFRFPGVE